jgi:hypothetical protein
VVDRALLISKLRAWLSKAWSHLRTRVPDTIIVALMVVSILAGVAFRIRGYLFDVSAFWLDEAVWAMNLTERPLVQNLIRPPGFIIVEKALSVWIAPTETVLRALPWAAGVAATIGSPWLARRLYKSPTSRLLFVAVIALNPCAIDFSKEFKPYSIGLFLHMSLVFLALRYFEKHRALDLGLALGTAGIGCLFAQDLIFAFPGLFLVLGYEALKHRKQHVVVIVVVAVAICLLLFAQYFFLWRHLPKDGSEYWGNKYNVFYTGKSGSYVGWALERYRDMTGLPGIRREFWQEGGFSFVQRQQFRNVDRVIWLAMHLMGLMVLAWQKRWREALLIVLPLAILWIFNSVGFWPMGAFRTNVFTLAYMTAIAAMAFDVPEGAAMRWFAPIPTLVLVALPLFLFEGVWHARKQAFTYDSQMPDILARLVQLRQARGKAPLILDRRSCQPYRFYTTFHPRTSKEYGTALASSYEIHCLTDDSAIRDSLVELATPRQAVWIILHPGHDVDRMVRSRRLPELYRISRFEIGPHTIMSFRKRPFY